MSSLKNIFKAGDHGSTFGGNHMSTTVCTKVLDILEEYLNSGKLGVNIKYFNNYLHYFVEKYPSLFLQKNGWGFMQGLVLNDENILDEIVKESLKKGVLVLKSGKNIIRFLPALNISKKEIKQGFERFESSLIEILKEEKRK